MNLIGKLLCKLPRFMGGGHRRGKRVSVPANFTREFKPGYDTIRCPRCGATWTRKVKAKKEKAA